MAQKWRKGGLQGESDPAMGVHVARFFLPPSPPPSVPPSLLT